jgi:PPOX class probable F420-dependent enzyme
VPAVSEAIRDFLEPPRFAVLATLNPDSTAQQSVVWYDLQDDMIMMNSKAGRLKVRNLQRDPRASLCIPDGYHYVTISAHATLIYDQLQAQPDIVKLAVRYHGEEQAKPKIDRFRQEFRVTIRMPIEHLYAYGI